MTLFWIICAVLLIVALPFVVLPLWRSSGDNNAGNDNEIQRDAANLEILRDQSSELEADLRRGLLSLNDTEKGMRQCKGGLLAQVMNTGRDIATKIASALAGWGGGLVDCPEILTSSSRRACHTRLACS